MRQNVGATRSTVADDVTHKPQTVNENGLVLLLKLQADVRENAKISTERFNYLGGPEGECDCDPGGFDFDLRVKESCLLQLEEKQ